MIHRTLGECSWVSSWIDPNERVQYVMVSELQTKVERMSSPPGGEVGRLRTSVTNPHDPDVTTWEKDLRVRLGYSKTHVQKSVTTVLSFIDSCAELALNRATVLQWITSLVDPDRPSSRKTAQNKASQLKMFFEFLVMLEVIEKNYAVGIKVPSARRRRAGAVPFSIEQVQQLCGIARTRFQIAVAKNHVSAQHGPLAETFYKFLVMSGLRYGEAGSQKWEDINLKEGWMILTKDKANRQDQIPLTAEAVELLEQWRCGWSKGTFVFPHRPSHNTLKKHMHLCHIEAQDDGVKGQWHRFRKCAVTERARRGADLRDLHKFARHTRIEETVNVYDHALVGELRGVAEMLPSLRGDGGKPDGSPMVQSDVPSQVRPIEGVTDSPQEENRMEPGGIVSTLSKGSLSPERQAIVTQVLTAHQQFLKTMASLISESQ